MQHLFQFFHEFKLSRIYKELQNKTRKIKVNFKFNWQQFLHKMIGTYLYQIIM